MVFDTIVPIGHNNSMKEQTDKLTFRLPQSLAKKFRIKVLQRDDTIQRICEEAVAQYLKIK